MELVARTPTAVGSSTVMAYEVAHASGAPAYGLRLDCAELLAHKAELDAELADDGLALTLHSHA